MKLEGRCNQVETDTQGSSSASGRSFTADARGYEHWRSVMVSEADV